MLLKAKGLDYPDERIQVQLYLGWQMNLIFPFSPDKYTISQVNPKSPEKGSLEFMVHPKSGRGSGRIWWNFGIEEGWVDGKREVLWRMVEGSAVLLDQQRRIVPWLLFPRPGGDGSHLVQIVFLDQDLRQINVDPLGKVMVPILWAAYNQCKESRFGLFLWQQRVFLPKWKKIWKVPS